MQYVQCFIIILITLSIIYYVDIFLLNNIEDSKLQNTVKLSADCIMILSKEDCPYCSILQDYIKNSKFKYTVITLTNEGTFSFDEAFISLSIEERNNMIEETEKIFKKGEVLFPIIVSKNKLFIGLPETKILDNIFNL
tara:strand:+ start:83 stop:496 length:414 start_codon:yes stop_codon:yes gene_type:complete